MHFERRVYIYTNININSNYNSMEGILQGMLVCIFRCVLNMIINITTDAKKNVTKLLKSPFSQIEIVINFNSYLYEQSNTRTLHIDM